MRRTASVRSATTTQAQTRTQRRRCLTCRRHQDHPLHRRARPPHRRARLHYFVEFHCLVELPCLSSARVCPCSAGTAHAGTRSPCRSPERRRRTAWERQPPRGAPASPAASPLLIPPQRASALSAQRTVEGSHIKLGSYYYSWVRGPPQASLAPKPWPGAGHAVVASSGPSRLWRSRRAGRRPPGRRSHSERR